LSWQRIRGHDALVKSFNHAAQRGRLAHAYLFTGPAGVGKHLFARELARALLCEGNPHETTEMLQACDVCTSCVLMDAGTHPDFFTAVRPEEKHEFPIELMRELCQRFSLKSARGRGKVAVIDDADDFNEESANAFLKTLEEPPPNSVLIIVSSSLDRQLPTIISRCQVIRFAPLALPVVRNLLQSLPVDPEKGGLSTDLLERLVRLSAGSPGLALALADPALWEFRNTLLTGLTAGPIDAVSLSRALMDFIETVPKEGAGQRNRARLVLRLLIDFFTDALGVSLEGKARRTEPADRTLLDAIVKRVNPERFLGVLERCLEADRQVVRRVQLVLIVEALLDALGQQLA
jgi:DNA polymerase III subunit delta'